MLPAKLSKSSRIRPNLKREGRRVRGQSFNLPLSHILILVCVCVFPPDSVVVGQVFLSELRLGAQRQVNLQEAVLHRLCWKVVLRLRQHGRQRRSLCHGLLVVAAEPIRNDITPYKTSKIHSLLLSLVNIHFLTNFYFFGIDRHTSIKPRTSTCKVRFIILLDLKNYFYVYVLFAKQLNPAI